MKKVMCILTLVAIGILCGFFIGKHEINYRQADVDRVIDISLGIKEATGKDWNIYDVNNDNKLNINDADIIEDMIKGETL